MDIRLLALDMDGTAMMSDHTTLSAGNRAAIEAAIAKGIAVVVATGRTRTRVPEQMLAVHGLRYVITANGAAVDDLATERTLYANPLPKPALLQILDALGDLDLFTEAYCRGKSHTGVADIDRLKNLALNPGRLAMMLASEHTVENLRDFILDDANEIEKLNFPYVKPEIEPEVWRRLAKISGISPCTALAHNVEINNATASKADGLIQLCGILDILPAQVMAVGDAGNDLAMLRFAGLPVAMGNATDEVKAIAAFVTHDNDHDGVAHAIETFLL